MYNCIIIGTFLNLIYLDAHPELINTFELLLEIINFVLCITIRTIHPVAHRKHEVGIKNKTFKFSMNLISIRLWKIFLN